MFYLNTVYLCFFSGDKKKALKHVPLLIKLKSKFLNKVIMKGLRFSSSLYIPLIWLRIFWWNPDFPQTVEKKMNWDFFIDPTADNYLQCIFEEIAKTSS